MRALALLLALTLPLHAETARPVVTEIVSADAVQVRLFTGVIEAEHQSALAFQTAGRVASLNLTVGDRVTRGQVLATLDQVTLSEDAEAARAALSSAQAGAELAQASFDRVTELNARGVASTQVLDAARQARDTATAQAEAAAANLRRALDAEGFGALTAPEDGVVLSIAVKPGTVVSAGTPVVTLALGSGREAVLDLPADYLPLIGLDSPFRLYSRVTGAEPLTGHLRLIEPVADTATRSRRIHVTLPQAPDLWRIGALVRAELVTDAAPVITLPREAVTGGKVWVVTADRKASLVPVTLGATLGARIVVTQGLSEGQEVVVKGVNSLTEGQELGERVE
ncbi:efflux RND transporter periplasmic adaptor subunit [Stagnihabitans tardus]|uniref:Efflux RND transporter periplasmic adaptor subunit n=1 Tax=Stagnihabitans tardus TaxID=2699202 RepID=A0AAE5BUV4_9RHOB|nr:efflux RND transporter periplasmic adaptor subunit [Stagnihabitans tardus]NBZ86523.1 efflux RND transporter periplasmic adaptor subunit [Stagnihabitans tardus]